MKRSSRNEKGGKKDKRHRRKEGKEKEKDNDIHLNIAGVPASNVNVEKTPIRTPQNEEYHLYKISIDTAKKEREKTQRSVKAKPSSGIKRPLQMLGSVKPSKSSPSGSPVHGRPQPRKDMDTPSSESEYERPSSSISKQSTGRYFETPNPLHITHRDDSQQETCFTIPGEENHRNINIVSKDQSVRKKNQKHQSHKKPQRQVGFADLDAVYGTTPEETSQESDDNDNGEDDLPYRKTAPQVYPVHEVKAPESFFNEPIKIKVLPDWKSLVDDSENIPKHKLSQESKTLSFNPDHYYKQVPLKSQPRPTEGLENSKELELPKVTSQAITSHEYQPTDPQVSRHSNLPPKKSTLKTPSAMSDKVQSPFHSYETPTSSSFKVSMPEAIPHSSILSNKNEGFPSTQPKPSHASVQQDSIQSIKKPSTLKSTSLQAQQPQVEQVPIQTSLIGLQSPGEYLSDSKKPSLATVKPVSFKESQAQPPVIQSSVSKQKLPIKQYIPTKSLTTQVEIGKPNFEVPYPSVIDKNQEIKNVSDILTEPRSKSTKDQIFHGYNNSFVTPPLSMRETQTSMGRPSQQSGPFKSSIVYQPERNMSPVVSSPSSYKKPEMVDKGDQTDKKNSLQERMSKSSKPVQNIPSKIPFMSKENKEKSSVIKQKSPTKQYIPTKPLTTQGEVRRPNVETPHPSIIDKGEERRNISDVFKEPRSKSTKDQMFLVHNNNNITPTSSIKTTQPSIGESGYQSDLLKPYVVYQPERNTSPAVPGPSPFKKPEMVDNEVQTDKVSSLQTHTSKLSKLTQKSPSKLSFKSKVEKETSSLVSSIPKPSFLGRKPTSSIYKQSINAEKGQIQPSTLSNIDKVRTHSTKGTSPYLLKNKSDLGLDEKPGFYLPGIMGGKEREKSSTVSQVDSLTLTKDASHPERLSYDPISEHSKPRAAYSRYEQKNVTSFDRKLKPESSSIPAKRETSTLTSDPEDDTGKRSYDNLHPGLKSYLPSGPSNTTSTEISHRTYADNPSVDMSIGRTKSNLPATHDSRAATTPLEEELHQMLLNKAHQMHIPSSIDRINYSRSTMVNENKQTPRSMLASNPNEEAHLQPVDERMNEHLIKKGYRGHTPSYLNRVVWDSSAPEDTSEQLQSLTHLIPYSNKGGTQDEAENQNVIGASHLETLNRATGTPVEEDIDQRPLNKDHQMHMPSSIGRINYSRSAVTNENEQSPISTLTAIPVEEAHLQPVNERMDENLIKQDYGGYIPSYLDRVLWGSNAPKDTSEQLQSSTPIIPYSNKGETQTQPENQNPISARHLETLHSHTLSDSKKTVQSLPSHSQFQPVNDKFSTGMKQQIDYSPSYYKKLQNFLNSIGSNGKPQSNYIYSKNNFVPEQNNMPLRNERERFSVKSSPTIEPIQEEEYGDEMEQYPYMLKNQQNKRDEGNDREEEKREKQIPETKAVMDSKGVDGDRIESHYTNVLAYPGHTDDKSPFVYNDNPVDQFSPHKIKIAPKETDDIKGYDDKDIDDRDTQPVVYVSDYRVPQKSLLHAQKKNKVDNLAQPMKYNHKHIYPPEYKKDMYDEESTEKLGIFGQEPQEQVFYVGRMPDTSYNVFFSPDTTRKKRSLDTTEKTEKQKQKHPKKVSLTRSERLIKEGPKGMLIFVNKKNDMKSPFDRRLGSTSDNGRPSTDTKRSHSGILEYSNQKPSFVPDTGSQSIRSFAQGDTDFSGKGVISERSPSGRKITQKYPCGCIRIITRDPGEEVESEEIISAFCRAGSQCEVRHPELQKSKKYIMIDDRSTQSTVSERTGFPKLEIIADGIISRKAITPREPAPKMRGANYTGTLSIKSNRFNGTCNFYLDSRLKKYLRNNMDQLKQFLEDDESRMSSRDRSDERMLSVGSSRRSS